jgi:hypothetical protein
MKKKILHATTIVTNFVYNIYTYRSQGCHKQGERKRNRERRKRKRREIEERGREIPLHLQRKVALCTSTEELHFALAERAV